jgi:hypothetical protein
MKGLIKLATFASVMTVLSACSCGSFFDNCNNPCATTEDSCCPPPHIFQKNDCCETTHY